MRRNPSHLREIWLATPLGRAREELAARAAAAGIVVHRVPMEEIDRLCPGEPHQGAAASLREFVYADLEEVAAPKPNLLVAADGVEGLRLAKLLRPDLALVDVGLPGISGYEIAEQLRSGGGDATTFLVALTGYGSKEVQNRSRAAGFDAHLLKPVDPQVLFRLVSSLRASEENAV